MSALINAKPSYKITGRYMSGTTIIGYELADINGQPIRAKKGDVERLAKENRIENCRIIEYNGESYIKGVNMRISELPVMNVRTGEIRNNNSNQATFTLTHRLMSGNNVEGYAVVDRYGKHYKLSKEKVWQLAREKAIENAAAQISGKRKILRGIGIELRDLPSLQILGTGK